jgi:hypothetical protein
MFNKHSSKSEINISSSAPTKEPSNIEKSTLSFWGLKIQLENPGWKTIVIVILFLIVVISIVILFREYILTSKIHEVENKVSTFKPN